MLAARRAPPSRTRPRPGRRTWWAGGGGFGAPNLLEVADFSYVPMTCGFGYTAFVVDAYAGLIAGWECSLTKDSGFVERALRHAAAFRARQGRPFDDTIHHSDAGSQTRFNRWTQHLDDGGVFDGTTTGMGSGVDGAGGHALTGTAAGTQGS